MIRSEEQSTATIVDLRNRNYKEINESWYFFFNNTIVNRINNYSVRNLCRIFPTNDRWMYMCVVKNSTWLKRNEGGKHVENLMGYILHDLLRRMVSRYAAVSFLSNPGRGASKRMGDYFHTAGIGRHWVTEIIHKVIPVLTRYWWHASLRFQIISTRIVKLTVFKNNLHV